ncbi:MAG: 2-hydroxyacid dehydrogenase [bacterium]
MRGAFFSTKPYDRQFFPAANQTHHHQLTFFEPRLTEETCALAANFPSLCAFVNDQLHAEVLTQLTKQGTRLLALRSAGFNHVDLEAAHDLGMTVVRVPAYSPYAVAEHTVGLILALNRKIHRAYARVREGNFALEGLLGFDLHGRTVGIVGSGKIGAVVAKIMSGFGCHLLAHDPFPNPECTALGARYLGLPELLERSDMVTLHCPLMPETHHLINAQSLQHFKPGAMLVNTSRGALIDTSAIIQALKFGRISALGLDVYEEEAGIFFEDLSNRLIQDDVLARLPTFPNVIITGHQAFFTDEALTNIAETTLANITEFEQTGKCRNAVAATKGKS